MTRCEATRRLSTERIVRPRFATRLTNALSAARKTGLPIRGLKISANGEIDIAFGKPVEDQSEDLAKLL
jgi:hypothetical protein